MNFGLGLVTSALQGGNGRAVQAGTLPTLRPLAEISLASAGNLRLSIIRPFLKDGLAR